MIYCYLPGHRIVLLMPFVKRTEEIRKSDLDLASASADGVVEGGTDGKAQDAHG